MFRNTIVLLLAIFLGSVVNMTIIVVGSYLIHPPEGVDVTNVESIAQNMHLYKVIHFVPPLLAHAVGTLIGAFVAAKFVVSHHFPFAIFIGVFFLFGGLTMAFQLPAPLWFNVIDLVCAYLPMAWFGYRFATRQE